MSVRRTFNEIPLERLVDAALGCPRQAIRVVDDDERDLVDVIGPRP